MTDDLSTDTQYLRALAACIEGADLTALPTDLSTDTPFLRALASVVSGVALKINAGALLAAAPVYYARSRMWKNKGSDTAANRRTLVSPDRLGVNINDTGYFLTVAQELDLDATASWDDPQYATAANRAGKDFYIYACQPVSGSTPIILLSAASTFPSGYNANTSRKVGQFHCECVAVGTITGHALTGYLAGDILPRSIQDLIHRPKSGFISGMVWGGITDFDTLNYAPIWKAIYMASGTGANVASIFGAATSTTRDWNAFVSDFGLIGCRMMRDYEFQVLATGVEEEVNITGSVNPTTAGGHISTTGRRMISNIGSEDDAGVWWQWLDEQSYRFDPDGSVSAASKTITAYHVASPGGNPIYAKFLATGEPYLCCNMATYAVDKWITFGTDYKILIKHDADAATGSSQIYLDEDATQPGRILTSLARGKSCFVPSNNPAFALQLTYNAAPATPGVALYFDDGAERLEFTSPTAANGTIDLGLLGGPAWAYYNLPGTVGSLYKQGAYGDVKLLGGGCWNSAANAGSRARYAYYYRWITSSYVGGRFVAEPQ